MKPILCLVSFSILFSSHPADDKVHEGVRAFYNYEYDQAVSILTDVSFEHPDHPGIFLILPAARWVLAQAHSSVEVSYTVLEHDLNEALFIYKDLIKDNPDNQEYRLYYGSALGLKARVNLGKKEWVKTLSNAYKGFRIIQDVAEKDSSLVDANLPIGIVEYYAGMSNGLIQFAAGLFGLDASREVGLLKIRKAVEAGSWSWTEASAILSFIYLWSDRNPDEAENFSRKLVETYPQNFYYRILLTESLTRNGKLEDAKKSLLILDNSIGSLTEIQQKWFYGYLQFEWALYHFYSENQEVSMRYVKQTISSYGAELDIILGEAFLLNGKLLDLKGERNEAVLSYRRCKELDNMSQAMRDAKEFLKKPFSLPK
ncbi:MAG: hypothetical protein HOD97_05710 [Candidatus Marinimicrobia bacterium]|nr:hypothetical protein [Candidatus Neomarinimicrobiota bacterium]MBT3617515.1 hypothetical protein [Candidatus Neomarinimicrobiota bacterium]MBT3829455.1 hypothetical protein [Candidatus Neomarinimicrobiota bacterium]MBT3996963.1 hypothetical protein [Candidatus Neomarinimicrobiota bacterium]MBT4281089.1 hypothetical protein [Candidatus Neomarinimicrobiota bacterium]